MTADRPSANTLQDLLVLEDDPGFVHLACSSTGVLAWSAIRNDVFRLLLGDRFYSTAPIIDLERRPSARRLASAALRSAAFSLRRPSQKSEVLIVGSGFGLIGNGRTLFNRHTDYFADALGSRAWTLEGLPADAWPERRRSNARLGFLGVDRLQIASAMRFSVRSSDRALAAKLVDLVAERASVIGWDVDSNRRASLHAVASRRVAAYRVRAGLAERILKQSGASVVLLEDGCFGVNAVFNSVARDRGVHVAEFQHGIVTTSHDAYNVHPRLADSDAYARTQPRSLLTYGDYWSGQLNAPVVRETVGNPHRAKVVSEWRPSSRRDALVVFGDGIETEMFLSFCRDLARHAGGLRVRFRPHPWERAKVAGVNDPAFSIDQEADLYRSLTSAGAVIGEASTALYEAAGLVPHVIVWDTPKSRFYLGDHPFPRLRDAEDLPTLLEQPETPASLLDNMWAPNWRERFLSTIDRLVNRPPVETA